ncbi:MAG: hypothetical protein HGB23_11190 [Chlorobiaceae bacterium]|nr:hypothetical protein [Chlorobiaceae bacterium]
MIKKITIIGFLLFAVAFNANAQDIDRTEYSGESVPLILEESVPPNSGWI